MSLRARNLDVARRQRNETRETDLPMSGRSKTERVNLGLELLSIAAKPGTSYTLQEIAAWCGCTRDAIMLIEHTALRKLANRLRFGAERHIMAELRPGAVAGGRGVSSPAAGQAARVRAAADPVCRSATATNRQAAS